MTHIKNRLAGALLAFCLSLPANAQPVASDIGPGPAPAITGYGLISLSGSAQSLSGTAARLQFDTTGQSSPLAACDTAVTKGLCTVATPGRYGVYCAMLVTATTGPAVDGDLGTVRLQKNAADWSNGGVATTYAQVISIASPYASISVYGVNNFATADTFSCAASSAATTPLANNNTLRTYMSYQYVGP